MKQIFSNSAVTELTQPFSVGANTLYGLNLENFPQPEVGEEYFMVTLVGACEQRVEIVRVIEHCGDCLRIDQRGLEGTEEQNFLVGDNVYHAITAAAMEQIVNRWQWYLGPFPDPPLTDNEGFPLEEGHVYYNTTTNFMMVYDGERWRPFNPYIGTTQIAEYTWLIDPNGSGHLGGTPLPWPDTYGQSALDWDSSSQILEVYLNGSKLVHNVNPGAVPGDYDIDYDADTLTILHDLAPGDLVQGILSLRLDDSSLDFIKRTETDASGYGFVVDEDDMVSDSDQLLPTQQSVKAYVDAMGSRAMIWKGEWVQREYIANEVVRDGSWTMIANKTTTARAAPQTAGAPEFSMSDTPTMIDGGIAGVVKSGNTYTFSEGGWVTQVRVWVPDTVDHTFTLELVDMTSPTNPVLIYSASASALTINSWNLIPIPSTIIATGDVVRVQLVAEYIGAGGGGELTDYSYEVDTWTTPPSWASVGGYLYYNGTDQGGGSNAYSVDLQFQPASVSEDWDLVALSGGGSGGGTSGDGTTHTISDVPPTNDVGDDGDVWFVTIPE